MTVSIIVAVSRNGVIGRGNELPWRLRSDLKRFKRLTMDHAVIMGRRTFESLKRPLPGRRLIVVTRSEAYAPEGVAVAHSLDQALEMASAPPATGDDELFIAGGGQIYRQAMHLADRLYVTRLDADVEGDAFFPAIDPSVWRLEHEERLPAENDAPAHAFLIYGRSRLLPEARLDTPEGRH